MKQQYKNSKLFFIVTSCLLFCYVAYRAGVISITWDEAFSYLEFTRNKILFPISFNGMSANNHLLNTWLTFLTTFIFGNNELSLRLPNLIAYVLFLFFTAKISNEFSAKLLPVSAFLILNLNPYLIDFFSLSRGYGLSYGLLSGSLWYLYLFFKNNFKNKYSLLSLVFAILACFAHLTLLYFVLALFFIVLGTDYIFLDRNLIFKKNSVHFLLLLFFLIIVLSLGNNLHKAGALFYGGNQSFWNDTIATIFNRSLYEKSYAEILTPVLSFIGSAVFFTAFVFSFLQLKNKNQPPQKYFLPSLVVLCSVCMFSTVLQHYLFNTLYLMERTALFLWILFCYIFIFFLAEVSIFRKRFRYVIPIAACFMLLHFFNCTNFYYVLEWKWDADTKIILNDIEVLRQKKGDNSNFTLGTTLEFEQPINYYRLKNNLVWLNEVKRTKDFTQHFDACIVLDNDFKKLNVDSFRVFKNYPFVNNKLIQYKFTSTK